MKTLYLGTDPSHFQCEGELVHFPVIKIVPRPQQEWQHVLAEMDLFTHLIFTSKNAVCLFFDVYKKPLHDKTFAAVGQVTASHLKDFGYKADLIAEEETQEGLIEILKRQNLQNSYFFLPRSSLSRPALVYFFKDRGIRYRAVDLYDTHYDRPAIPVDLKEFDQIIFTSPSTVEAFFQIYKTVPAQVKLVPIGPITKQAIDRLLRLLLQTASVSVRVFLVLLF